MCMCVSVSVCVCMRACVRVCDVHACVHVCMRVCVLGCDLIIKLQVLFIAACDLKHQAYISYFTYLLCFEDGILV